MKNSLLFLTFLVFLLGAFTSTLNGLITWNVPTDKATLAASITDLNAVGTVAESYLINLETGNPQTTPAGGYIITATGTSSYSITIQGNGNMITAYTPQASGILHDAIFEIDGGDYITIQNFVMQENAANTTTTVASNNMTEFGVAVFYFSTTNGAKYITIQNNAITLNRAYQNTFGIYANDRHSSTAVTTAADITAATGAHDYLHIYANQISNVNKGIVSVGSNTAARTPVGLDIGGSSSGTGNTISNYGTVGTISAYVSVGAYVYGILTNNHLNCNISFNSITSSVGGVTVSATQRGIIVTYGGTLPTSGSYYRTITHNSISVKDGSANSIQGIYVEQGNQTLNNDISYNDFHDIGYTQVLPPAGNVHCIWDMGPAQTTTISYNTFTNLNVNTTATLYLIHHGYYMPNATSVQNIHHNSIVGGLNKTGSGASLYCTFSGAGSPTGSACNIQYNDFSNITVTGGTSILGIWNNDGPFPTKVVRYNTLTNWTGGTGSLAPIQIKYNGNNSEITDNTINTMTNTGLIDCVTVDNSQASALIKIEGNDIFNINGTGGVRGIVYLVATNIYTVNILKNKVHDLTGNGVAGYSYGIVANGFYANIYNNMIYDLKAPDAASNTSPSISGIYVSAGTTNQIHYNSVYLNASGSNTAFSSAAIYLIGGTTNEIRNNIFDNECTPGATGFCVALWKSATGTTYIGSNSNKNIYYAGSPDARHLIGYFSTTAYSMLEQYKAALGDRDQSSFTEDVPFISATNLHISTGVSTLVESNALVIMGVTTDIDNDPRNSLTPDIGADEGDFYDYPNGVEVTVGDVTITVAGGNANNGPGDIPAWSNPLFIATDEFIFDMLGAGPWTITIGTAASWGAYYLSDMWHAQAAVSGQVILAITDPGKGLNVPVILGDQDPTLPVELSSFTAVLTSQLFVQLNWTTQTESGLAGYYIYRNTSNNLQEAEQISMLIAPTNTSSEANYQFTDAEVASGNTYYYWLQNLEMNGSSGFHGPISVFVNDDGGNITPPSIITETRLLNAYPNPFQKDTIMRYTVKEKGLARIEIFNVRGQLIRSFTTNHTGKDYKQIHWDGTDLNGNLVSSGVYYTKMTFGNYTASQKIVLMK
jgi:trimeric autotransporter adhesin